MIKKPNAAVTNALAQKTQALKLMSMDMSSSAAFQQQKFRRWITGKAAQGMEWSASRPHYMALAPKSACALIQWVRATLPGKRKATQIQDFERFWVSAGMLHHAFKPANTSTAQNSPAHQPSEIGVQTFRRISRVSLSVSGVRRLHSLLPVWFDSS